MKNNTDLIQYIIVNKDLNMSAGKIAAQVGHACTLYGYNCINSKNKSMIDIFINWLYRHGQRKVVLKAHEKDIRKLIEKDFNCFIIDEGNTEVPSGSLTALCVGIYTRKDAKPIVNRFQAL